MDDIIAHVREGNALQVRLWLDNTENDLNQGDDHRFSLLHWSAREGRLAIVELLIQRGARVNATNMGDDTPLHLAAAHGHRDVVHSLIGHKACINAINEHGNTPLHYACFWNHIEVAELLVNNNASVLIENKYGETPLDKARPRTSQILENLARALGQTMQRQPYRDISYLGTKTRSRDATLARFEGTLDPMQLQFRQRISVNHGSEVWIGAFKGHEVAVKLLRLKQCTIRHSHDFNEEVLKLRIFNHPNISPVLGSVNSPPKLCLLSYYMPYGSLHNVLHGDNETIMVDAKQALRFALDIASAMEFLHTPELKVNNYRLNSKHVMIDENLAKICSPFENSDHKMIDEDLTAKLDMADYKFSFHEKAREYNPAWMSPEALQKRPSDINMQASDMWSFGIVLWEMETRQIPFADLSPMEIGMRIATENMRVKFSPGMSRHIVKLINLCLKEDPGVRPRFDMLVPILKKMRESH